MFVHRRSSSEVKLCSRLKMCMCDGGVRVGVSGDVPVDGCAHTHKYSRKHTATLTRTHTCTRTETHKHPAASLSRVRCVCGGHPRTHRVKRTWTGEVGAFLVCNRGAFSNSTASHKTGCGFSFLSGRSHVTEVTWTKQVCMFRCQRGALTWGTLGNRRHKEPGLTTPVPGLSVHMRVCVCTCVCARVR